MSGNPGIGLNLPTYLLREDQTFSMDFGSSRAKIVYAEKDAKDSKYSNLKLVSFPREDIDDILTYFKDKLHVKCPEEGETARDPVKIDVTGVGAVQFMKRFQTEVGIKLNLVSEMEVFIRALNYLFKQVPLKDLEHPPLVDAMIEPRENVRDQLNLMKKAATEHFMDGLEARDYTRLEHLLDNLGISEMDKDKPILDSLDNMYPVMLALAGSAHAFLKIEENGTYSLLDVMNSGGKSVFGKGKAFLHVKSFEEFLHLAETGDNHSVDIYQSESSPGSEGTEGANTYGRAKEMKHDALIFNFGKAANQDPDREYSRADLARALLLENIILFIQAIAANAQLAKTRHVFICGSLPSNELVRQMITSESIRRNLVGLLFNPEFLDVELHFLKQGSHLGAIGTMLKPPTK